MIRKSVTVVAMLSLGLVGAAAIGLAQPEKKPAPKQPEKPAKPDMPKDAQQQGMDEMEAMNPGPPHAKLMKLVGDWDEVTKMELPGMPATETKGSATIKSALDGRFLHEEATGEFTNMPLKSMKFWGYNMGSKKYEGTWAWTMSTSLLHLTGTSTDEGKTINLDAWYEAANGHKDEFKVHYTFTDDDHFTVRMDGNKMADGNPGPVMTSTYSRKKK
jgi:hypothetical protein